MSGGNGAFVEGSPFDRLMELQDLDIHLDQLNFRRDHLKEREDLALVLSTIAKSTAELEVLNASVRESSAARDVFEEDIASIDARSAVINERLRGGSFGSYRDQETLAGELEVLARRKSELEDGELEVLEILEPLESAVIDKESAQHRLSEERDRILVALGEQEAIVDAEIKKEAAKRPALAEQIPPALLNEYESLRTRLDGIGAARLVRGTCSGCHLSLPATDLDRIRHAHPDQAFHCEQCGRILVA